MGVIMGESVSFVNNSYFTDDTVYLNIDTRLLRDIFATKTFQLGLSFHKPEEFNEDTMAISFQSITYNGNTLSGGYNYIYKWDISSYQQTLRQHLDGSTTSEVYIYAISTDNTGTTYMDWHRCYMAIGDIDAIPIFTVAPTYKVVDTISTQLTGNTSTIIRYVSDAQVSFSCEARKESLLKNAIVKIGSQSSAEVYTNTATANSTIALSNINGEVFNVTVSDSRGLRMTHSIPVEKYIKYFYPTCNLIVTKPTVSGGSTILTADGLCFNGSFGYEANFITVEYRYKSVNGSYGSWKTMSVTRDGEKYTATANVSGLNYQTKYVFQARVTDKITNVSSIETIIKSEPVFDWSENDFQFNVPLTANAGITTDSITTDSITTNSTTTDSITTNSITLNGEVITTLQSLDMEVGTWTPSCNGCSTPTQSEGHYVKFNDLCIINFYFQGTIDTFLKNDFLYFSDLPFSPDASIRWQSGGGTCSYYMSSSSLDSFTGWSIESGRIYGRINSVGSTSVKAYDNNGTSYTFYKDAGASYVLVGATGVTLYASGTIMYKIA